jgi:hypothetical protein
MRKNQRIIYCCTCESEVQCNLINAKEAYPHRDDIYGDFWQCQNCKNFVGCHAGIKKRPLGCIPTPEIKNARRKLHEIIDPLWQKGKISRGDLYKKISGYMDFEYHTAELRTIEDCRKVWSFVKELEKSLTGHVFDIIDNPEDYINKKCHVVGWHIGMVFVLQSIENGFFVLKTPKTNKIYKTKNQLSKLRGER